MMDILATGDAMPGPSEVARLVAGPGASSEATPGGAAFIAALTLRELGHAVRLWHPLPGVAPAGFPLARLIRSGIDLSHCPERDEPAPCCIMIDSPAGRLAWSGRFSVPDIDFGPVLDGVDHVIFAPVWEEWSVKLLTAAQAKGIAASLFGEPVPAIPNQHWDMIVNDRAQHGASLPYFAKTLCITAGANPLTVRHAGGEHIFKPETITVTDSTGAGDSFAATFMGHVLGGASMETAVTAAMAAGALACQNWGAWSAMEVTTIANELDDRARVLGALAGTACGDAFGMPNSFLKQPVWRAQMEPGPDNSPYHAGYSTGRITDDTEQAIALTDALEAGFTKDSVAKYLNDWFLSVGGSESLAVGPSTKRALEAYQRGESVETIGRYGVTNGAPMRISPIGVLAGLRGLSLDQTADIVETACWPTHATSPAISGALAIAWAIVAAFKGGSWDDIRDASIAGAKAGAERGHWVYAPDIAKRIEEACRLAAGCSSKEELCEMISDVVGAGEPCAETIPAAIAIGDFAKGDPALAIELAGNLRGDTDTIAAIAGAICGAYAGLGAIPQKWITQVEDTNNLSISAWADRLARSA